MPVNYREEILKSLNSKDEKRWEKLYTTLSALYNDPEGIKEIDDFFVNIFYDIAKAEKL